MDKLLLLLIVFYQRFVSPHKGLRCAYGVLHHTHGCSGAVKEIVLRNVAVIWFLRRTVTAAPIIPAQMCRARISAARVIFRCPDYAPA
ncbi:membrane protein insertion efficiency factor YidD [Escherichia coli]|uniref:membrane protein insertion efficiency factor YidD n=1 Tax=Escherichia sp. MOD1-EC7003 TaxID=2093900 RepID=UPI001F05E175|nr:membrane protein insertion efficiency factor YidD [Escherichia sp. MOD1-EC7003]MCH0695689.1 membrane protein insertion efficiency factor YidD [Escherichia coli]